MFKSEKNGIRDSGFGIRGRALALSSPSFPRRRESIFLAPRMDSRLRGNDGARFFTRTPLFLGALFILLATMFTPAYASSNETSPIHITADHWQASQETGIAVYTGNVIITQGNVRITADEARILMREGVLQHLTIIGSPATFVQTPDKQPPLRGEAQRVEYNAVEETATLTGNALLQQGVDTVEAASIFVDIAAEKMIAHSNEETPERVHIVITPKAENSADTSKEKP